MTKKDIIPGAKFVLTGQQVYGYYVNIEDDGWAYASAYTYAIPGTYTVLEVFNPYGGKETYVKILSDHPNANTFICSLNALGAILGPWSDVS
jgi:hypothetical protein